MATRRERVVLELEDSGFTSKMARDAAATTLLRKALDDLDGTSINTRRSVGPLGNDLEVLDRKSRRGGDGINQLTGRLRLLTDAASSSAPRWLRSAVWRSAGWPLMTAQLGATAGALGVTLLAVNGLGDGLKALDAYQLEPTTENLEKLQEELDKLGPSGEHFVLFLDSIEPSLKSLQMAARDGVLPGFEEGIDGILRRLPQLHSLVGMFADEVGTWRAMPARRWAGSGSTPSSSTCRPTGCRSSTTRPGPSGT